ncbi:MAG: hypothetical protein ACI9HE_004098, partial [Planctomycetota bacterium]
ETPHQLHQPSYQSKYPPAQALFLALGQRLWHPILGVWLSVACLIGALVWMLQAWLPGRWALAGGLLGVAQFVVQGQPYFGGATGYWSQSYWGGAVAAMGGALLFGGLARTLRSPRVSSSLVLGLGLMVLANSRPREGLLVALPVALYLLVWMVSSRSPRLPLVLGRVVLPVLACLVPGFMAMGKYHKAVTGDALEMPWMAHYEQYCVFPVFLWQEPEPDREWRHMELRDFHGGLELEFHERHAGAQQLLWISAAKLGRFWIFFIGPVLSVLLLLLPWVLRDPWMRFLCIPVLLVVGVGLVSFGALPHYSAPVAGPMLALLLQGLRHLRSRSRGLMLLIALGMLLGTASGLVRSTRDVVQSQAVYRNTIQRGFDERPGEHLVFVRYGPEHTLGDEWIYNAADIDGSKTIWARSMDEAHNQALIAAYPERQVWVIEVGFETLSPLPKPYR